MSTLRVTNIQDTAGANSSTSAQIFSGRAKAWVNFNGTGTVAIRANFNVSSITDNGVGDYTVNFATAMPDANYALTGTAEHLSSVNDRATVVSLKEGGAQTSSSIAIVTRSTANTILDPARVNVAIFR